MKELIEKLKQQIIEELQLHDMVSDDFDADTILFGEGLGLDSIDTLQLVVLLDRQYGIKIKDPKEGRVVMQTVRTMANYIVEHQDSTQPSLSN
jgi:acyl carrier protein